MSQDRLDIRRRGRLARAMDRLRERLFGQLLTDPRSCGEGCYMLEDGILVPLGDLGVHPAEYDLKP